MNIDEIDKKELDEYKVLVDKFDILQPKFTDREIDLLCASINATYREIKERMKK